MAINKKLIHFKLKSSFETELANNNLLDTSIVFIQETKEIWTHGQLYKCSDPDLSNYVKENELQELLSPIQSSLANKLEVSDLAGYAKTSDIPAAVTDSTVSNWGFMKTSDANETYAPKSLVETVSNQATTISTLATKNELSTGLAGKLDNSAASSFVPTTRTINGTALTDDIWITATDPNAATKEELNGLEATVANKAEASALANYATTDALSSGLSGKQETLVSGTNIKTIEGKSILGSGDIQITAAEVGAYTTGQVDEKVTALNNAISGKVDPSTVNAVSDRVSTLEGYFSTAEDSDATINKWGEIVNFLDGVAEGSNVEQLLAAKANQSALNDLSTTVSNVDAKFANYLPLSGGTITGDLTIKKESGESTLILGTNGRVVYNQTYDATSLYNGGSGFPALSVQAGLAHPVFRYNYEDYALIHSGNIGSQSVNYATSAGNADTLDNINSTGFALIGGYPATSTNNWSIQSGFYRTSANSVGLPLSNNGNHVIHCNWDGNAANQIFLSYSSDIMAFRRKEDNVWKDWKTIAFTDSDITGTAAKAKILVDAAGNSVAHVSGTTLYLGDSIYPTTSTQILGKDVRLRYGANASFGFWLNESGNVTIGGSDLAGSDVKLCVEDKRESNGYLLNARFLSPNLLSGGTSAILFGKSESTKNRAYIGYTHNSDGSDNNAITFGFYGKDKIVNFLANGNVGIGTTNPQYKLHVGGDGYFSGQLNVGNINGYTPITSGNIGSQSVSYATTAGTAGYANSVAWDNVSDKPTFARVATSGSYVDLIDKPTIPTDTNQLNNSAGFITAGSVGNGTVTITQNGTSKGTFTMNQFGDTTIELVDTYPSDYATTSYVDTKVANLVDGAPETLDTLDELAEALRDNKDIVTVLEQSIGSKQDKSTAITTSNIGSQTVSHAATATDARYVVADNNAALPQYALLNSGLNRLDDSTGDTWIYYDALGGSSAPWGIKHNQTDNYIEFYGAGDPKSFINLSTGNHYAKGFVNTDYWSAEYALTSNGGVAHIPSMSVNYANSAGSATDQTARDAAANAQSTANAAQSTADNKWTYSESTIKGVKVNNAGNADTVAGFTVGCNVPANAKFTDNDTHYTTGINAGATGATSNSAQTNPYVTVKDNSTYRGQIRLVGGGATTVTSDASGNITISSTDTNTHPDLSSYAKKTDIPSIPSLSGGSAAESGKYVSGVTVSGHAITVTKGTLPTIPSVGNGTVTIKQNGTTKGTFTMNQSGNTTIELTDTNTDTNTHYTTRIYAGASGTAANASASDPYVKITDDNTYRNQIQIKGSGATKVSSDANGVITISSTDTNTHPDLSSYATQTWVNNKGYITGITKTMVTNALGYTPPTTNTTYSAATTSAAGLMSATDKSKLDGIASGATAVSSSTVSGWGFTKNAGTVTGIKINGSTKSPSSGVVDLGTVITSHQSLSGYATQSWVQSQGYKTTDTNTWRPVYNGVDSTATDTSASANAVRLAYGRADSAYNLAAGKQDVISDLSTIRSQASNGNTAYSWGNHANYGYLGTSNIITDSGTSNVSSSAQPVEMMSFNGLIVNGSVFSRNGSLYVADNPYMPSSTHWLDVYSDPQSYGGVFYEGQIILDLYPDRFYDLTHNPLISGLKINSISGWDNIGVISHNIVRFKPTKGTFTLTLPSGIYWANGNPIECEDSSAIYEISFIKRNGGNEITATWTKFTQA